jgi:spore cortex formation protein SpoVR/YcgB (stage V sporulation)
MSMNIHVQATCKSVLHGKNGQTKETAHEEYFSLWQTPTSVTYEIVNSDDPYQAYLDWLCTVCPEATVECNEYAIDDFFCKREPIGVITVPSRRIAHEIALAEWINTRDNFYEIVWFYM